MGFLEETAVSAPLVSTDAATNINTSGGTLNGTVDNSGGDDATVCGFAWGTYANLSGGDTATTTDSVCPSSTGSFSKVISSGSSCTTYYFRAYATNPGGTGYGDVLEFYVPKSGPPCINP